MSMTNDGLSCWQAESEGSELLDITIGDLLDRQAEACSDREALVYSCYPEFGEALDIRWTYRDYHERANAVARGLLALGLDKGDHIAIWAANLPQWPLLQMAAAKAGLVLVTINPVLRATEVEYILKQGDIRVLFCMARIRDHDCLATIRSLITSGNQQGEVTSELLPPLRSVCLLGTPPVDRPEDWCPLPFDEMVIRGEQASDAALSERQASVGSCDTAMILYTSGTTGFPKGTLLTHHSLINNARLLAKRWGANQDTAIAVLVPFFHAMGCVSGTLSALCLGCSLHPLLAFEPLKALRIISRERCTLLSGTPTMITAIMQHPDVSSYDLSSLQLIGTGGASVPVALMEQVKERIGADVFIGFGQTEATCGITTTLSNDPFELKAATVGKPLPHTSVKIINAETGMVTPVGEKGELCCRGYLVMAGYYKMPEKTAEAIDAEGWLHTGDLATMDGCGYVSIVGRLKDMVIRGGENLFPREIEEFLIRHPRVADVQVVGVPDAFFGEELLAVIIPKHGEQLSERELRSYCKGQISHQKIPRYFQFVTSYPLTGSGKVQKFVLRENAIKAWDLEILQQK
ncbi:MAG TPA: AMP-binding protein [Ktedonobacteraceae bacterium]|nr:AMP-binding protein [Ktedonobacteraceae bacterium]